MANENNLIPFKKGKSGNPKGRPRKLVGSIILELKEKGIEPVKPSQIVDTFEKLFNLRAEEIKEIATNDNNPYFLRRIAKEMLSNKGFEIIGKMLDRTIGKTKNMNEIEINSPTPFQIIVQNEEQKRIIENM
jgi:hypothetical protein